MKKVLFSLFLIALFLVPAFADYTVDSVSVSAQVATGGKTQVTTTIALTFDTAAGSVSIPLPDGDISHVSAGDFRYQVSKGDSGTDVVISSTNGFTGTQTFLVSYTLGAEADSDDTSDAYHLGLLSSRWGKSVGACSFQVVLPGSATLQEETADPEATVVSGYYGSLSTSDSGLQMDGNVIRGESYDRMAYDSLDLEVTLPEGYFYVRTATVPGISVTWQFLGMVIFLCLVVIYWRAKLFSHGIRPSPRQLPPEGLLSCQLPQALDGSSCDLAALVLEWANLGYVSVARKAGQVVLLRKMPMGSERSRAERLLYARIFGKRRQVVLTPGRFAAAGARFQAACQRSFARVAFDRKGGNPSLVRLPCRLLLGLGAGYTAYLLLPEGGGYVVLAVLLGLFSLAYARALEESLRRLAALRKWNLATVLLAAFSLVLLGAGLLGGSFLEMGTGVVAIYFSGLATAQGPRRNQRGQDLRAQTLGCRMFYRRVTWQRLQVLLGQDEHFFQNQLPRAVALGVDRALARRFETLGVPVPQWLQGGSSRTTSAQNLQRQLAPILRTIRKSLGQK